MSTHTIAELQANPRDLIDRASKGEAVTITDDGKVVATLNAPPIEPATRKITPEAVEWLRRNRVGGVIPEEDAGAFVSRMRDEDWQR